MESGAARRGGAHRRSELSVDRPREHAAMRQERNGLDSARCDGRVKIRCMREALRIYTMNAALSDCKL
jgi:hypothetical protein